VSIPHGSRLRPVAAIKTWLEAAGRRPGDSTEAIRSLCSGDCEEAVASAGFDPAMFSGHSLRAGFVTSALHHGADILRAMDVTRHREVSTLKAYDRRAKAFKQHAGEAFL